MSLLKHIKTDWLWLAALLLAVSLHLWFPRLHSGPVHDTYGIGAGGKKAFYLLAEGRYGFAERKSVPLQALIPQLDEDYQTLCLLGPARYPTEQEWKVLLAWVRRGGSLLIAARETEPEFSIERLDIQVQLVTSKSQQDNNDKDATQPDADQGSGTLARMTEVTSPLVDGPGIGWISKARIVAPDAEPLAEMNGTLQAVRKAHGQGMLVVVASDFIFSNQALAWGENANSVLAVRLLEAAGTGAVVFDESLNESGTPKVVGILLDPVLRPLTVQLTIVLVLFGWWRSRRFGPLESPADTSRRNLVDHTDAVGIHHYRANNGREPLRMYMRQLVSQLRLKVHKGREDRVLTPIGRRLGRSAEDVRGDFRAASQALRAGAVDRKAAGDLIGRLAVIRRAANHRETRGADAPTRTEGRSSWFALEERWRTSNYPDPDHAHIGRNGRYR